MAQQPQYNSTIAPANSTGEVLDTETARLAAANAQALASKTQATIAVGNAGLGIVNAADGIFQKLDGLNQRSKMLERVNQYEAEKEGVIANLQNNTQLLADWAVDEGGGPSEYMRNWQEARYENLTEGLNSRHKEQFELIIQEKAIAMNKTIGDMALAHAHSAINAATVTEAKGYIDTVDPSNIQTDTALAVESMSETLAENVRLGVTTPLEAAQAIGVFTDQMVIAGHTKAVAEIQFGEGLPGTDYPQSYGGAMDYIEDMVESDQINQDQADSMMETMATRDSQRWSQGAKQQQALSNETFMGFIQQIDAAKRGQGPWPSNEEILNHEAWRPDTSNKNWSRAGDTQSPRTLISYLEDSQKPPSGESWNKWDEVSPEMMSIYDDVLIDNEEWSQRVMENYERWGMTWRGAVEWAKSPRSNIYLESAGKLDEHVDARYAAQIRELNNDGKFEEANALYAVAEEEKVIMKEAIQGEYYSRENAEEVIGKVVSNYYNNKISGEIFRDWEDPDRKLNYAEELLAMSLEGKMMGQSGLPRVNEDLLQMGVLHRGILENEGYTLVQNEGGRMIGNGVWGKPGTMWEGRVSFKVKDPHDGTEKWVTMGQDSDGEEVVKERGFDWKGNEIWQDASAVSLNRIAAERVIEEEGQVADARVEINQLIDSGASPEILAQRGYNEEQIELARPGYLDQFGSKPLETTMEWYNSALSRSGNQMDYDSIVYQAQANSANVDEVIEEVWKTQRPNITHIIRDMFDDNEGDLWRKKLNGEMVGRRAAATSAGQVVMRYGLPPSYGEKILEELYDWSR